MAKVGIKYVNSRKFEAIMKKRINLHKCPKCPAIGGEIIIPLICYAKKWRRVYIRCNNCGFETKSYDANACLYDTKSNRFGNFVIDKSLIDAIHNAINDWNGELQPTPDEAETASPLSRNSTEKNEQLQAIIEYKDLFINGKLERIFALERMVMKLTEENERLKAEFYK